MVLGMDTLFLCTWTLRDPLGTRFIQVHGISPINGLPKLHDVRAYVSTTMLLEPFEIAPRNWGAFVQT